ncbi:MAG: 16S rRNA (guanine(527)-N(7))-methyltransferase RsmG [Gammaproteobacteria bacterium]|nr:16S rRNA (guanine(527)-N(7))-methyltransferase RsmG [Gammaproteobacteria bacterium]
MSSTGKTQQIIDGVIGLGLDSDKLPVEHYSQYLDELARWNKAYNLTAIRDFDTMVSHHILDSLVICPFITGNRCLDVGTGAGFPGMVLAMAKPDQSWVLVDSKVKKTRFLNHIAQVFNMVNVEIVHGRVEEYQPETPFDLIVSRAFSDLGSFIIKTDHLVAAEGRRLAMKGKIQAEELEGIKNREYELQGLQVPGVKSERNLVIIR